MRQNRDGNPYVCYSTSPSEDIIANAEGLALALGLISKSANAWKWAVLAADMLVTTALVLYVNDTSGTAALAKRSRKEWLELIGGKVFDPVPERRVEGLHVLLELARSDVPGKWREPLVLSDEDAENITHLHTRFRNEFVHFKPDGLLIYVDGLPAWLESAVKVAETVLRGCRHYWDPETDEVYWRETVTLIRRRLQRVELRIRDSVHSSPPEDAGGASDCRQRERGNQGSDPAPN